MGNHARVKKCRDGIFGAGNVGNLAVGRLGSGATVAWAAPPVESFSKSMGEPPMPLGF